MAVRALLLRRRRVLVRLACWSALEAGQTFLLGFALARALDDGFLAGDAANGLRWLAAAAVSVVAGAYGTGRAYRAVAALVEPLRDDLVRRTVRRALREPDRGAVSRLTHQVEIARDTFAGVLSVARSFVFTAGGALVGLCSLAPVLLLLVVPPLVVGLTLFLLTLRPLARRQERFLVADERLAAELGGLAAGLRDITASGAERWARARSEPRIAAETSAALAIARWSVVRVLALTVAGRLPIVLLLAAGPWLLHRGVTPGALAGALGYLTQSLLPALTGLMHGLGTSGARLTVVLRRLTASEPLPSGRIQKMARRTEAGAGSGVESGLVAGPGTHLGVASGGGAGVVPGSGSGVVSGVDSSVDSSVASGSGVVAGRGSAEALRLTRVTFAYGAGADAVVRDLDLVVPRGGRLVVVGPSGIGKSTLLALMAGVIAPDRGQVALWGEAVGGRSPGELARERVLVPQEAYVFSGTVRENLAYLCPAPPDDAALLASCEAVGAAALVGRLGGLSAGVRPGALSAGERQLLALARAHAAPAPLVLLDEAASHLGPRAEAGLEPAFAGRTLVVVSHNQPAPSEMRMASMRLRAPVLRLIAAM